MTADRRSILIAAIRREVPRRPGVYLFSDCHGSTIYVGKSVDLRSRVLSYFSSRQVDDRVSRMVHAVDRFRFRETKTELLALLLEDVLIKLERPAYNARQRDYEACRYLLLTDDPYPALRVVDHDARLRGQVFGPFKDEYLVDDIRRAVGRYFGFRDCVDPAPNRKCLNFDLGQCAGPCRGAISKSEYQAIVGRVANFLRGNEVGVIDEIGRQMHRRAADCQFEHAARLRDELAVWTDFCRRQRFIEQFRGGELIVRDRQASEVVYRFAGGSLVSVLDTHDELIVPDELACTYGDPRFILDRANLLHARLWRHRDDCGLEFR